MKHCKHSTCSLEHLDASLPNNGAFCAHEQIEALADALEGFGKHPPGCGKKIGYERTEGIARIWSSGPCTCPIGDALRAAGRS